MKRTCAGGRRGYAVIVRLHSRCQIQKRVNIALNQRKTRDLGCLNGAADLGGTGVDFGAGVSETVTVSVTAPTVRATSTRAVSLTCRTMSLRYAFLKPEVVTSTDVIAYGEKFKPVAAVLAGGHGAG